MRGPGKGGAFGRVALTFKTIEQFVEYFAVPFVEGMASMDIGNLA